MDGQISPSISPTSFHANEKMLELTHSYTSARWASWFGGPNVQVGARIVNSTADSRSLTLTGSTITDVEDNDLASMDKKINISGDSSINYRSCSWQKTAMLMLAQYVGLAIMCFPAAFSDLGWVGGMAATILNAAFYQYTSMVLWQFCLRHPEVRDICDIGRLLLGGKQWAWWFTAIMFVTNNTCVMGIHIVVGSEYLNTITAHWITGICRSVLFCFLIAVMCWLCSLARTFNMLANLATFSAATTFVSVLLAAIFTAVQDRPANWDPEGKYMAADGQWLVRDQTTFSPWPASHSTFTSTLVSLMSISYTFIGQISLPSYIAEMKEPRDFPKALWISTIVEFIIFSAVGIVIYKYTGTEYITSPAFGSLNQNYKLISFSLLLPSIVFIGALYASITARFVFFRVFMNSKHMYSHTIVGWCSWGGILMIIWTLAFTVSQIIPFFSALLSLVGAVFDAFFGFLYWGIAWFRMRTADKRAGHRIRSKQLDALLAITNIIIIVLGVTLFLFAGTIASAFHIRNEFARGRVKTVFSCASNAL